ncbi:MAG: hypothetical protein Q8N23_17800 [Archangium sp.]|nr:hypothetical protein [Archangium sp.]MDP3569424.1 hypothetical protein [Archangium sp.]
MRSLALALLVLSFGCGVSTSDAVVNDVDDVAADDSFELSTTKDTFLIARRDYRKCVFPMCGGYWVKDLNSTMQERYVSGFDFTGSGLSDEVQQQVATAPDNELVLFGRLGPKENRFDTRSLKVLLAYRGLPGQTFEADDKFYKVFPSRIACITTPCANLSTTRLNRTTGHTMASDIDVNEALGSLVEAQWVHNRVLFGRGIVAGRVVRQNGHVTVVARQVFVELPDRTVSCPKMPEPVCADTEVPAYERTENRCVVPSGCTLPRFCAAFVPACDEGYSTVSWQNGCTRHACEPTFLQ